MKNCITNQRGAISATRMVIQAFIKKKSSDVVGT